VTDEDPGCESTVHGGAVGDPRRSRERGYRFRIKNVSHHTICGERCRKFLNFDMDRGLEGVADPLPTSRDVRNGTRMVNGRRDWQPQGRSLKRMVHHFKQLKDIF
jgi:hypothetical protein